MTDDDTVTATDTESAKTPTLFVQISEDLDAQIAESTKLTGLSKSGLVRLALPLGIRRFEEINGFTSNTAEA